MVCMRELPMVERLLRRMQVGQVILFHGSGGRSGVYLFVRDRTAYDCRHAFAPDVEHSHYRLEEAINLLNGSIWWTTVDIVFDSVEAAMEYARDRWGDE